jgi:SHS2 domain-containing protein
MNDSDIFPDFVEIPHKSDAALIVYGHSLPELFSHAALGMYQILGLSGEIHSGTTEIIALQAPDHETLLVSFLTELLFLAENGIKVNILGINIKGRNLEIKIIKSHIPINLNLIKAVTFNEMKIVNKDEIYQTRIIFDL